MVICSQILIETCLDYILITSVFFQKHKSDYSGKKTAQTKTEVCVLCKKHLHIHTQKQRGTECITLPA